MIFGLLVIIAGLLLWLLFDEDLYYKSMIVVGVGLYLLLAPLAIIWGLNTLFPALAIPFTVKTWLAVYALGLFFGSARQKKER